MPTLTTSETKSGREDAPEAQALDAIRTEDEILYLIGRPTLKQYLRFVRGHATDPPDRGALIDEWMAAHDLVRALEKDEAGLADEPSIARIPLDPMYEPLLIEFLKDPLVRHGFNIVPTEVVFVELDRLVVYQKHIDLTHVRRLESDLGPAPTAEQVFRTCLPCDHPQPPVRWARGRRNQFVFVSPSNDLRFLGAMPLKDAHIRDYPPPGSLVGVVGLAVGFGSNFLNALYAEGRLILNNGSHRAYALRKMGVTHVPCIVQHVSSRHQLAVVAASDVEDAPDLYMKSRRPPMLRDYFDPRLRRIIRCQRRVRQVTVRFEVDESYVPAL